MAVFKAIVTLQYAVPAIASLTHNVYDPLSLLHSFLFVWLLSLSLPSSIEPH